MRLKFWKRKRYFLVFYTAGKGSVQSLGSKVIHTERCYLNREKLLSYMKDYRGYDRYVVTNIVRLTKREYKEWGRQWDGND